MSEMLTEQGIPVECGKLGCERRICVPYRAIKGLVVVDDASIEVKAAHQPSIECDTPDCGAELASATFTDPFTIAGVMAYAPDSASTGMPDLDFA